MAAGLNLWKDYLIEHTGNTDIILFNLYSMGMLHDADRGCTGNNIGVMGGYGTGWSSCSKDDMNTLLQCVLTISVQRCTPFRSQIFKMAVKLYLL